MKKLVHRKKPRTALAGAAKQEPALPNASPAANNLILVAACGGKGSASALAQILARVSSQSGITFLFNCAPEEATFLSSASVLPVEVVEGRTELKPDRIYIPARGNCLILEDSKHADFQPSKTTPAACLDNFLRSVALAAGPRGVAVLLSGTGTDGLAGLQEVKAQGGITFVQEPSSAEEPELLTRTISETGADFVLSPRDILPELLRLARLRVPEILPKGDNDDLALDSEGEYARIFTLLRALTGVDFSYYKSSTLKRRIARRMVLNNVSSTEGYVHILHQNPAEVDQLFQDILINVTSFFRDPAVFQVLEKKILPRIIRSKAPGAPLRLWVPGCSTGEEVYSLAMTLLDTLGRNAPTAAIQIFATDISETALVKARAGFYPPRISGEVSQERLRRYFHQNEKGYQISKYVRDLCVFARQNLFEDPPFSRIDLISCRNVLIYLGPVLQKKIFPVFHYALRPGGHLLLGGSESIGLFTDLFELVDKRHKLFKKRIVKARQEVEFSPRLRATAPVLDRSEAPPPPPLPSLPDISRQADRILLTQYGPAGVVVNSQLEVVEFRGQTGLYLEHHPGEATLNLVNMARQGLAMELRTLISRAAKLDMPARREGVAFGDGKQQRTASLEVLPFHNPLVADKFFLVLFTETAQVAGNGEGARKPGKDARARFDREAAHLREELISTKESLQAIIEEQEATNEELKSANEEIQSSNEELQSTNEELETAKEELQSTNEELTTLNEEVQARNLELSVANNDLMNLLSSVNLPILMLGNDLTIRHFTQLASQFFNLIPTDVGRRISDINPNIEVPNLSRVVTEVIDTLRLQDMEIRDRTGRWYSLRIRPYRTSDNKIEGAVLVLVDIDEIKRALEEMNEMVHHPLLMLRGDFRVHRANEAFYKFFGLKREETEDVSIFSLADGNLNIPPLHALLKGVLPERKRVDAFTIDHVFPGHGKMRLEFSARLIQQEMKGTQIILLAIQEGSL